MKFFWLIFLCSYVFGVSLSWATIDVPEGANAHIERSESYKVIAINLPRQKDLKDLYDLEFKIYIKSKHKKSVCGGELNAFLTDFTADYGIIYKRLNVIVGGATRSANCSRKVSDAQEYVLKTSVKKMLARFSDGRYYPLISRKPQLFLYIKDDNSEARDLSIRFEFL